MDGKKKATQGSPFLIGSKPGSRFVQDLHGWKFLFPVRQFGAVSNRDDGSTIQPNLDVGLQLLFRLFSSCHGAFKFVRHAAHTSKEHISARFCCLMCINAERALRKLMNRLTSSAPTCLRTMRCRGSKPWAGQTPIQIQNRPPKPQLLEG